MVVPAPPRAVATLTQDTLALTLALTLVAVPEAAAQDSLFLVNDSTTVRRLTFRFPEGRSFEVDRLKAQIATLAPGPGEKFRKTFRFIPGINPRTYPFDRVELQKDVVRLRRFYQQNGFPRPRVDYPSSQFSSSRNSIWVVLTIWEGPPLLIQDVSFFDPAGRYAYYQFDGPLRQEWIRFRDRNAFQIGERYTETGRIRIQDLILTWLKDRGYAFAVVTAGTQIDSTAQTVDLRFVIDTGPMAYFSEIQVEGNASVTQAVVERELPFQVGDRFSNSKLSQGQQELFRLNLFRVALADLPEQPRDSTVTVRFRVREAKLRYLTAQAGFGREEGLSTQGTWRHRNFLGEARLLTLSALARSGLGARLTNDRQPSRGINLTASLQQPFLFTHRLSAIASPFYIWEDDPNQVNLFSKYGLTTTLLYDLLPFRTLSLQYTLSHTVPLKSDLLPDRPAPFTRSLLTLSGLFGRVNNFLNPRRGLTIRPYVEAATGLLASDVEEYKAGAEVIRYQPITRRTTMTARLVVGRLWPVGGSADQTDLDNEFRFDEIRFYAGGSDDVRGWTTQLLGAKLPRQVVVRSDTSYVYEAVGALAKLTGAVEVRWPFPGLPDAWRLASFFDFGQLSARPQFNPDGTLARHADGSFIVNDDKHLRLDDFQYSLGGGLRYRTPAGFLRLDVAFKLNPAPLDLQRARDVYRFNEGLRGPPEERFIRRLKIHLSIDKRF